MEFSLTSTASETDFQIEVDLFQNESFCTSLEHMLNTWETLYCTGPLSAMWFTCGTSWTSSEFRTKTLQTRILQSWSE